MTAMWRVQRLVTIALMLALGMGWTACGDAAGSGDPLRVVATTTILGDVARNVVGEAGEVEVLIPVGADPHDFLPSARQVATMADADLIIVNGLQLEESLLEAVEGLRDDGGRVLEIAPLLSPLPFSTGDEPDPHVWMDPRRMAEAATLIAAELSRAEPEVDWVSRGEAYSAELLAADSRIEAILERVPAERRKLVTGHDSLGYFAARYGFQIAGVLVPGGSTLAEPSSSDLADLVDLIEREGINAIFTDATEPSNLAAAVAAESDDVLVVELFMGSLGGPGSGAETLIDMLVTDAELIAEALS